MAVSACSVEEAGDGGLEGGAVGELVGGELELGVVLEREGGGRLRQASHQTKNTYLYPWSRYQP